MKKMNKLVALLLAAVMVLGMMPTMSVHAHAHGAEVLGIEEYPALPLNTETLVNVDEYGKIAYFTFTPEKTDLYHFYSSSVEGGYADTYGHLYDAGMKELASNDDANYPYAVEGISSPNFCVSYVMEAGTTYILAARLYSTYNTGSFNVTIIQGHEYTAEVTKEATCSEDGVRTYTCAHCGESYDETIPAAHTYSDETGKCIYCDEVYLITGTCGENLTWSLDWFGKLTISGTGDMYHYVNTYSESYPAPWYNDHAEAIKTVVVEEGVTSIGNYAFNQCGKLTAVELPETVVSFGSNAFASCHLLESIKIPTGVTEIPDRCFSSCGSLTEVEWNENLTSIGSNAFYGCALGDTVLPEGITFIGQSAFSNCDMTRLTLPSTLTELDTYSLSNLWSLQEIVFSGDAPAIGVSAFNYATATAWYPEDNATWTDEVKQNYGGTITWKGLCTSHTWGAPVNVPATCLVGSYMTMTCSDCGFISYSPKNDDALGHDLIETFIEPNCANWQYGYTLITCTRCDYEESKDLVPYEHDYVTEVIEATCETDGYTKHTCTVCGNYTTDNYVYATGHSVADWSETTEATCEADGVRTGICANCSETVTEIVTPALGHEWDKDNGTENADGTFTYPCIRCDATYTTEGNFLYVGDNHFSMDANTGRRTKTFTAEADGTLTISISQLHYYNAYSGSWNTLALDWVFSEGFFNIYVNGTNSHYTVEGSESSSKIILSAIDVKAGDTVTVEVNQTEYSYYYADNIQFNMNLAFEGSAPVVPEGPALVLGDNEFSVATGTTTAVYNWTAAEDTTLVVEMTKLILNYFGFESEETPAFYLSDRSISMKINGEPVYTAKNTLELKAGDVITVQLGNTTGFDARIIVNLSVAGAHEHSYEAVVTAPTCTEGGYTTYTCECGDSYIADETAALGHTEETVPGTPATFDAAGLTDGVICAVCGETLTAQETIPALDYNEGIVPIEVLTATAGDWQTGYEATEGPAALVLDDDFSTIWHTNWYGTSRENHWIQFELSETYIVDGLRLKPRTTGGTNGIITKYEIQVSNDGETFTTIASGEWEGDSTWKVVEFEGQNVKFVRLVALDGITDQSYVFASAAEIRLTGEKTDAPSHEHTASEAVKENEKAATCTEAGSYESVVYCAECGEELSRETVTVEALGHDFVVHEIVPPTCTKSGYTVYKCTRCDKTYKDDPVEPEHKFDEGTVTAPTCTELGFTTYTCTVCGEKYVDEASWVPALGHDFVNGDCSRCDAVMDTAFEDVPVGSFYFDPVKWAVDKGITTGATATTFDPNGNCMRAVVVTFLWRAAGSPEPTKTENPFTDVSEVDFFYKAVLWAVEKGITNGTSATEFSPYTNCNRAQVVTFLYRAMGEPAVEATEHPFTDVVEGQFYYNAMLWAVENGITNGISATAFGPTATCNRAQVVTFLYRAYNK